MEAPPLVANEVCRLCLVRGMDMLSIFSPSESFADKILDIVQLEVTEEEDWPSHICQQCASQLNAAYNFRECCLIANTILSNHIGRGWLGEGDAAAAEDPLDILHGSCHINVEPDIILDSSPSSFIPSPDSAQGLTRSDEGSQQHQHQQQHSPPKEGLQLGDEYQPGDEEKIVVGEHCECADLDYFSSDGKCTFCGRTKFVGKVCLACNRTFKTKKSLVCHLKSHVNSTRLYSCFYCDATFDSVSRLEAHTESHDAIGYSCKLCAARPADKAALVEHAAAHVQRSQSVRAKTYHAALVQSDSRCFGPSETDRGHGCGFCLEAFPSGYELSKHSVRCVERAMRGNADGASATPKDRAARWNADDVKAMRQNTSGASAMPKGGNGDGGGKRRGQGDAVHTCQTCGKSFHHLSRLQQHKRTHDAGKLYPCVFCAKSFSTQSFLAAHILTHSGIKRKEHSKKVEYFTGEIE